MALGTLNRRAERKTAANARAPATTRTSALNRQSRIAEVAYFLWVRSAAEGACPDELADWLQAEKTVDQESRGTASALALR